MPPGRFCDCHCREEQANSVSNERLKPCSSAHALGAKIQADSVDCHNIEFMTPLDQAWLLTPLGTSVITMASTRARWTTSLRKLELRILASQSKKVFG